MQIVIKEFETVDPSLCLKQAEALDKLKHLYEILHRDFLIRNMHVSDRLTLLAKVLEKEKDTQKVEAEIRQTLVKIKELQDTVEYLEQDLEC